MSGTWNVLAASAAVGVCLLMGHLMFQGVLALARLGDLTVVQGFMNAM